jgi:hypothetical protein
MFHADGRADSHYETRCAVLPSLLLLPFRYKCRPQHFILEVTTPVFFSFSIKEQVSHPCKTTGNFATMIPYLIFPYT